MAGPLPEGFWDSLKKRFREWHQLWGHVYPHNATQTGIASDTVTDESAGGESATPGSSTEFSRGDHGHGSPSGGASFDDATSDPLADGTAASDGTENSAARKDHVHPENGLQETYDAGRTILTTAGGSNPVAFETEDTNNERRHLTGNQTGDTLPRWAIGLDVNDKPFIQFHDGSTFGAMDTKLYRDAADHLRLEDGDKFTLETLEADTINEKTAANGVSVDGVLLKDGLVAVPYGGTGAGTFTDGGVMVGNGTGILNVTAQGNAPSATAALELLRAGGGATNPSFVALEQRVSITVLDPAANDKLIIAFFNVASTIREVHTTRIGGTSVTWNLYMDANYTVETTKAFSSDQTTSTENTATRVTPNTSAIAADDFLTLEITGVSGPVDQFHLTLRYTTT